MKPFYQDGASTIYHGDNLEVLPSLESNSVDSVCVDPPYGLSFMGKQWDYDVPGVEVWRECLRVLKPGGHLLSFGGTRTHHRLVVNIEDAGFEIRDMIAWIYGSGFPKSLDVSKAIDKKAGVEREIVDMVDPRGSFDGRVRKSSAMNVNWRSAEGRIDVSDLSKKEITKPATPEAEQWQGWGTALKPALEPICVARKPLSEKTVAANVLKWGTGGINIDGCRVETSEQIEKGRANRKNSPLNPKTGWNSNSMKDIPSEQTSQGRWPANLIHDGSEEVLEGFPETASTQSKRGLCGRHDAGDQSNQRIKPYTDSIRGHNDKGSAARFFYCAKSSKRERGEGNDHPTVKPTDLMRYLVTLVTPPGGTVLDHFMGSGPTLYAAKDLGRKAIGIEIEEKYCEIAAKRLAQEVLPL